MTDILNAFRVWRRRPLVAAAAILTFALGVGANLAVFQLIWTVMLKPLPYPEPDRIVQAWQDDGKDARKNPPNELIERWRDENRSFSTLAAFRPWQATVSGSENPERLRAGTVSAELFETLGVRMRIGRGFTQEETRAGTDRVVILSHAYWSRRFSEDQTILQRDIQIDGELCKVVGVLPSDYRGTIFGGASEPEIYLPLSRAKVGSYTLSSNRVVGRLKPGVTATQAQQDLAAMAASMPAKGDPVRTWLSPIQEEVGFSLRPALIALFAATVCVLLIACFNIANLLMSHAASRQRELAIRAAMGASRARLIRQILVESVVLSLAGGVAAFAAAAVLMRAIIQLYPDGIPRAHESGSGEVMIGVALAVTLGCGLLVGLLPAWRVTGGHMEDWLRVGHGWMARARRRWADGLVAAQVSLTVAVLIGAGLLTKSFVQLRGIDPGFSKEHIITAEVALPSAGYSTRPEQDRFIRQLTERVRTSPGVIASGLTNSLPLRYTVLTSITFRFPWHETEQGAMWRGVTGSYFQTMGLRMADGRPLGPEDDNRKDVMVVNQAFVRKFLEGRPALGSQSSGDGMRIVGVVKDVHHRGLREAAEPEIYFPMGKLPAASIGIAVRTMMSPGAMTSALNRELRAIDSGVALHRVMTMEEVIDADLARPRFQTLLLSLFGAVALALATIGGYGVVAHNLRGRTQEFGVRRAVGAQTGDILALVTKEGMRAPLLGLVLGCGLAWAGTRYLSTMLYGVQADDTAVWLTALGLLAFVCLAACAWAGRLAVRVQPSQALRNE